jgi:hypothetical protein
VFRHRAIWVGGTALVVLALAGAPMSARAQHLTPTQRAAIDRDGFLLETRQMPGSTWPAATVYVLVDATPEEAAAVFADYNAHRVYIPSVKQSRISRVIDRATVEVDYEVDVPLVGDERYTVRNHVSCDDGKHFRVDWTLVRATSTKATIGHAEFSTYVNTRTRRTGTLLEYYDFVTPGSRLASVPFVKNRAIAQIEATARSIAAEIVASRRKPDVMKRRIAALRASVEKLPAKD